MARALPTLLPALAVYLVCVATGISFDPAADAIFSLRLPSGAELGVRASDMFVALVCLPSLFVAAWRTTSDNEYAWISYVGTVFLGISCLVLFLTVRVAGNTTFLFLTATIFADALIARVSSYLFAMRHVSYCYDGYWPVHPTVNHDLEVSKTSAAIDNVHFSLTTHSRMAPGRHYIVNLWAHLVKQLDDVLRLARRVDVEAAVVGLQGPVKVARGALLRIRLNIDGLEITNATGWLMWDAEIANATFPVYVPSEAKPGIRTGVATIDIDGMRFVRLHFVVTISDEPDELRALPLYSFRYRTAFASYASEDRDAVLSRVQGFKKINPSLDVFLDATSLRSGDDWQQRLRNEIIARDVFYLFWSSAASRSKWVEWEWRCAMTESGIEHIDPVPIEPKPPRPDPPLELNSLHFDDPELHFMSKPKHQS